MTESVQKILAEDLGGADRVARVAVLLNEIEDSLLPRTPTALTRRGDGLKNAGAVALGLLAAALSIFLLYIFLTIIFHFQP